MASRELLSKRQLDGSRVELAVSAQKSAARYFACKLQLEEVDFRAGVIRFGLEYSRDGGKSWRILVAGECDLSLPKQSARDSKGWTPPFVARWGDVGEAEVRAFYESDRARSVGMVVEDEEIAPFTPRARNSVAFNAATSAQGTGSTLTFAHTTSGDDRALGVGVSQYSPGAEVVSGVTFNGDALSPVVSAESSGNDQTHLWAMAAPDEGAFNVVVSFSSATRVKTAGAVSVIGADQTTPISNSNSAVGSSTAPSVTVTTAADELLMDVVASFSTTPTAGSNQTGRWDQNSDDIRGFGSTQPGANGGVMSWAITPSRAWSICAMSFKAAADEGPADFEGTGDLDAQASTIAGSATRGRVSTGALDAQSSEIAGSASVNRTATGSLEAGSAEVSGDATVDSGTDLQGSGALQAQAATVSGTATVNRMGSGALAAQAAQVAGTVTVQRTASGTLAVGGAQIDADVSSSGGADTRDMLAGGARRRRARERLPEDYERERRMLEEYLQELERQKAPPPPLPAAKGRPAPPPQAAPVPRLTEAMARAAHSGELQRIATHARAARADQQRAEEERRKRQRAAAAAVLMMSH